MADHEGDFVSELRRLISVPPSAMALAVGGDPSFARDVAFETGEAMRRLGVNVVLAPVADCFLDPSGSVTGIRTFGADPERVAEFVAETIRGYSRSGILTCAKHFPGHGSTRGDSHLTLPRVHKTLDELERSDHVAFSLGDTEGELVPASFDVRLIRGVLREKLGFEGVVITDSLEMEGARAHVRQRYGGLAGGFERSILAGTDLLLYSSPVPERIITQRNGEPMIAVEVIQTIIDTLERVVDRDRIDRKIEEAAEHHEGLRNLLKILDESEARIGALRERAAAPAAANRTKPEGKVIDLRDYSVVPSVYKNAAERSIVLVRDPRSFLPISSDAKCALLPVTTAHAGPLKRQDVVAFAETLGRSFPDWDVLPALVGFEDDDRGGSNPVFARPPRAVIDATRFDPRSVGMSDALEQSPQDILLPVYSARGAPPKGFLGRLSALLTEYEAPFIIITGWPIIDWIPEDIGCLLTFGASPQVAAALSGVLTGGKSPRGLPDGVLPRG
jgi:beta-glucosidase-like glycosyl hydrolase